MGRYLTILEVSQKQAFIFGSNKLKENIKNSEIIAQITDAQYIEKAVGNKEIFDVQKNLVYAGGGHTVLEFESKDQSVKCVSAVTGTIRDDFNELEMFAKTIEYDNSLDPGKNLKNLTAALERKKALRKSAFHQGSFGVESIDTIRLKPVLDENDNKAKEQITIKQKELSVPAGFNAVDKLENLGGKKGESNFVAIVHIDGNAMGKRMENFYEKHKEEDWDTYKDNLRKFSESIDADFKQAYADMEKYVANNIRNGKLSALELQNNNFPVRRIITAGDDICFISEGRIGIECAVSFIKALTTKINPIDNSGYSACAGVAIVHQKYPFFKAYELAEMLCSNAKKFGASIDEEENGKDISSIDWHIEYGEIKDTLGEIRSEYTTVDGNQMELRPYIVHATEEINKLENVRQYENFKKVIQFMSGICKKSSGSDNSSYARGKVKELRNVFKQGDDMTQHFLKFNKMEGFALEGFFNGYQSQDIGQLFKGKSEKYKVFTKTYDGKERCVLFDAIEIIDTFVSMED